ncbi:hypothetical protein M9H77_22687 [Catharanthus roseus]|uniref:Uncharacterized protein n=1 Tax=Catharanthus roseus TaxID=4058 RepID=A0ACC0AS37_CATRO|nr:hypothetical protein M9H77_22687 [Catharanthus roseus]
MDAPTVAAEALSYPSDEYIKWYRGITRVYIGNPVNRDTRTYGYQDVDVDRRMMEPPSSPSQMALFAKKVQTIIRSRRIAVPGARTGLSARGVKRGARRHPGHGAGGGRPPVPPAPERHEHVYPDHIEVERGEGSGSGQPPIDPFDSPNLDMPSFSLGLTPEDQLLPSGSGTSQTSLPPANSSTRHQPISQASLSDEEEWADDMDDLQRYGFGHCVDKKTTRFTPSDWP